MFATNPGHSSQGWEKNNCENIRQPRIIKIRGHGCRLARYIWLATWYTIYIYIHIIIYIYIFGSYRPIGGICSGWIGFTDGFDERLLTCSGCCKWTQKTYETMPYQCTTHLQHTINVNRACQLVDDVIMFYGIIYRWSSHEQKPSKTLCQRHPCKQQSPWRCRRVFTPKLPGFTVADFWLVFHIKKIGKSEDISRLSKLIWF